MTMFHYSAAGDRPANKAFVAAYKKEYGANAWPNFISVGRWDAMQAIFDAINAQGGKLDADSTMAFLKGWKNPNSPRGPISIDPATRDIIQNEYVREVRRVGGVLANVELETIPAVRIRGRKSTRSSSGAALNRQSPRRRAAGALFSGASDSLGSVVLQPRQHPVPRTRVRGDPVRDLGRPVGDHGPDGIRQPRARRVRDGGRLSDDLGDAALGLAWLPALLLACAAVALASMLLERLLYARLYGAGELEQVLFTIGLIFVAVAVARLAYGTGRSPRRCPTT
jgi:hypothetical protein